jgi:hypothetical protein
MRINKSEAIDLVEQMLNLGFQDNEAGRLKVVDERTIKRDYGWIFFYNTERYLMSKERRFGAIGNGPIAFLVASKHMYKLRSDISLGDALSEFEKRIPKLGS